MGHVVGQGLRTGGQGDAQQGAEGLCGEGVQILQGKTDGAFAFQRDAGQRQAHSLGDHGGYGGKPKKPLIRMALPATFRRFMETESTTTSFSRV